MNFFTGLSLGVKLPAVGTNVPQNVAMKKSTKNFDRHMGNKKRAPSSVKLREITLKTLPLLPVMHGVQ